MSTDAETHPKGGPVTWLPGSLVDLPDGTVADAVAAELRALAPLEARLGHAFARPALLRVALTVGSWRNENRAAGWPSNATLEFFGDAVLDLAAADALWRAFSALEEGPLTRLRSTVVSEPSLAEAARALDLGAWLFVGRGDERRGARDRDGTLADALEAVIGATFLDARERGEDPMAAAGALFDRLFGARVRAMQPHDGLDAKSRLQQIIQARQRVTPVYVPAGDPPPPDDPAWRARVEAPCPDGSMILLGEGQGRSLRDAERAAAVDALDRLGGGDELDPQ